MRFSTFILILFGVALFGVACTTSGATAPVTEAASPEAAVDEGPPIPNRILENPTTEDPPDGAQAVLIANNLERPVAFAFAPDGRLFFTEKETGQVRLIVDDELQPEPVLTLPVGIHAEQGLLGIAIDPDFEDNHHIWIYHTLPARENNDEKVNRVVRFTEQNNVGIEVTPAFTSTNSSGNGNHNAGNLVFDDDGYLYVSLGDDTVPRLAQDLHDPRGSILRYWPTIPLSAPEENPFYDGDGPNADGILAYGFRNPFDFVLDPLSDSLRIIVSENGPSCEDEINLALPGNNYGWHKEFDCDNQNRSHPELNSLPPLLHWTPTTSPTGITIYTGDDFPEYYGDIFYCTYLDAKLHRLQLNQSRERVIAHSTINGLNCQTDVFNGPDGALYYLEGGGFSPGALKRLVRP